MRNIILLSLLVCSFSVYAIDFGDFKMFFESSSSNENDVSECIKKYGKDKCFKIECIKIDNRHPACQVFNNLSWDYGNYCCGNNGIKFCRGSTLPLNSICFCSKMTGSGRVCK